MARYQRRFPHAAVTAVSALSLLVPLITSSAAAYPATNNAANNSATINTASKATGVVSPANLATVKTTATAAAKSATAKQPKLLPVDEASKNPDFKKFRDQLIAAVKNKDLKFIRSHLDKNIKNGFGGEDGAVKFFKQWKLNQHPEKSPLWYELGEVLRLGGSFTDKNKTSFMAPYTYSNFPDNLDGFTYAVIIDKNVNLRAKPSTNSRVVAKLNYDIVEIADNGPTSSGWRKIKLANGTKGYVAKKYFRSPVDYRGEFTKSEKDGVWRLTFFVAGD